LRVLDSSQVPARVGGHGRSNKLFSVERDTLTEEQLLRRSFAPQRSLLFAARFFKVRQRHRIPLGNRPFSAGKGYNPAVEWQDRVSVNPAVRSGKPCLKGTRITVYDVLEYLAGGMTEDEILNDFPDLSRSDIRAALAFAAARERRLANSVA